MQTMKKILLLMIGFVLFGTLAFFMAKFQFYVDVKDNCDASPDTATTHFFHPSIMVYWWSIQTLYMFFGEFLCLGALGIHMKLDKNNEYARREDFAKFSGKHKPTNFIYCIASAFDFIASSIQYLALVFINGSTFQIIRSCTLISTAVSVRYMTRMQFKRNHIIGCLLSFVGLVIVGVSDLIGNNLEENKNFLIGVVLMVVSIVFAGMSIGYQQRLFTFEHIEPLRMVGFEGLFGIVYSLIAIAIMSFIHCPFDKNRCVCSSDGQQYFQGPTAYFEQLHQKYILIIFGVLLVLSAAVFNAIGAYITKIINGLGRSVLDSLRACSVWIVGVIITKINGQLDFENLDGRVLAFKSVGFILIIFATLVFNELLPKRLNKLMGGKSAILQQSESSLLASNNY